MSDTAIRVEGLSKAYQIRHTQARSSYRTLREDLVALAQKPLRRAGGQTRETFWALDDVSFEVKHGEALGIIGRNGAGKSTLLKILSRITKPTKGMATVYGRVGSLLEVGTGFHPELTGRENIFLNGAILGMTRRDIQRHFDEIVDFAEIEQFLDTPVKRYSSGMYMRLAFAVAAHLEPEVLVVDEVLAVGDAAFQKKCLGKMGEVASGGRTVLFVSHNMAAVQALCERGLVLKKGKIAFIGGSEDAIQMYTQAAAITAASDLRGRKDRKGDGRLRFTHVEVVNSSGQPVEYVLSGQNVKVRFHYESDQPVDRATVHLAFNIYNSAGVLLTNLNTQAVGATEMPIAREGFFECRWDRFNLRSGLYTSALYCEISGQIADWMQNAFSLSVEDGDYYGTGAHVTRAQGDLLIDYTWSHRSTERAASDDPAIRTMQST